MVELVRLVALLPASDVDATYRKMMVFLRCIVSLMHVIMVLRRKLTVEYIAYISRWRPAQAEPTPLPLELNLKLLWSG